MTRQQELNEQTMKKVRLFVNGDMTVIDLGEDTFKNFHSHNRMEIIANVRKITKDEYKFFDGEIHTTYIIETDFMNPFRGCFSKFRLDEENFRKVQWIE